jgi:hypothetical protein
MQHRFMVRTYRNEEGKQRINMWFHLSDGVNSHGPSATFSPEEAPPLIRQILSRWNQYAEQVIAPHADAESKSLLSDSRSYVRP